MVNEPFEVHLTSQAEKDLKDLRPWQRRVIQELLALEDDPVTGHMLKGSLSGVRSLEFSLPGGAHRAVYIVETLLNAETRACSPRARTALLAR